MDKELAETATQVDTDLNSRYDALQRIADEMKVLLSPAIYPITVIPDIEFDVN